MAPPRSAQLERIILILAQLGADQIILASAEKFHSDYFGFYLLHEHHEVRKLLIKDLSQTYDVVKTPETRML